MCMALCSCCVTGLLHMIVRRLRLCGPTLEGTAVDEEGSCTSLPLVLVQGLRCPAQLRQRFSEPEPDEVDQAPIPKLEVDPIRVFIAAAHRGVRVPVVAHA